jgi:hypothetical protein
MGETHITRKMESQARSLLPQVDTSISALRIYPYFS